MSIRSFIAMPIPKDTANELGDLAAKMSYQDKSGAVKWVDQENYHVTLAFLGQQEERDLESLAEQLDAQVQQMEFLATLSHLGPFPEARPKLIAAMLQKSDDLEALNADVATAVRNTGMRIEKRKFLPHVTLGRFRHSKNVYAGTVPNIKSQEFYVDEIVLYESVLTSSGAEYEPLFRFPLELSDYSVDDYSDDVGQV